MGGVRILLVLSAAAGLAACGNHSDAPVVYGADSSHSSRIYNSRDEIYRKQQVERLHTAQAAPASSGIRKRNTSQLRDGISLTPVSAVYLSEDGVNAPAEPQKVKGYIEVQPGDTVYAIARRFSVPPAEIIDENDLRAPYTLKVGQALKLPKGATATPAATAERRVVARDALYAVRRGDTLYSISRASRVSPEAIAQANRLRAPYALSVGQQILIPQAPADSALYAGGITSKPKSNPGKINNATSAPRDLGDLARSASYDQLETAKPKSFFEWPVKGAIIASYGSGDVGRRNDGVNIAAPAGTPVRAAADGEVVYRGSELDGFGNLLLIKHADGFVTAYAHNDAMLVKKGDNVRQGQMIAKVGDSGAVTSPQLHFEIRQNLKSIDPVALLGTQ